MILDSLTEFVGELRGAGLPVSLTESLDALEAVTHVDIGDRRAFAEALAATLVKRPEHRPAFDAVFEVWFALRADRPAGAGAGGSDDLDDLDDEEVLALVEQAVESGDRALLAALARQAVARFAGIAPGRPTGASFHLNRALRRLDLDGALLHLSVPLEQGEDPGSLEARLRADAYRANLDRLRASVEAVVRRQLVVERGPEAVARSVRRPLPSDVDFMHASREETAAVQRALRPLTRRLAVRLARRRRHRRRGPLDFRATVRHSLSSGGVPAEPRFRHRRPARPELMVVADVSGSVAAFARFTLQFVHALSGEFSGVRSFVFVDGIDEVTHIFDAADDLGDAIRRVDLEADVVWAEGHSDYGRALGAFWARWGDEITSRTTVMVLGDARTNYHPSRSEVLAQIAHRARHLWWLNPEPRSYWDTGDSVASEYAVHCDGVFECRNLRQLEHVVEQLA